MRTLHHPANDTRKKPLEGRRCFARRIFGAWTFINAIWCLPMPMRLVADKIGVDKMSLDMFYVGTEKVWNSCKCSWNDIQ